MLVLREWTAKSLQARRLRRMPDVEKRYVLCAISGHGQRKCAHVHSRMTARNHEAKQRLAELNVSRADGSLSLLTLVREERLRLYELPDEPGIEGAVDEDADETGKLLRRRLSHAVVETAAAADGYLNLRAGSGQPSLRPDELPQVLGAFAASSSCTQLGFTRNAGLGDDGARALADAMGSGQMMKLEGLYLSHCDVGPSGAEALVTAMLPARQAVRQGDTQGDTQGSIVRLGLNFNRLDDGAASRFARVLERSAYPSLQVLGLSGNRLGDAAATALAEALASNSTLRRLFLTDNLIGCAGATRFGHLLASGACATLERLGLAHNRICQDGGLALAVGAEANSPECDSSGEASRGLLERLCLFGNPFLSPQDPCYSEEAAARLAALPNVNLSESKV